ncbi:MAG TPA: excinuclease ABC subunit UvrA [Thermoanaerobaculia bacterium]|nr:excinuclease ABC subunit UvrA [Thermoanaerobaculia bacterium]
MKQHIISIRGARTHNLKGVDVDIPQRLLTVITGRSGSGKSSLAFDTLYAEGQRRFVESMSTYVRQFLERMNRPEVESIDGILPAISIEQKNSVKNARSTVATATEIADYARLFMTYCGETFCPVCGTVVKKESAQSVASIVMEKFDGERIVVLAPITFSDDTRGEILMQLIKAGYYRAWIDGAIVDLKEHDLSGHTSAEIVLGRFAIREDERARVVEAIEQAFSISRGVVTVLSQVGEEWKRRRFTYTFSCDTCETEFPDPVPHLFSFNSPLGACPTCQGYGRVIGIDLDKVIPNRGLSLNERPIAPWNSPGYEDTYEDLEKASRKYGLRLDIPIDQMSPEEWELLYRGRSKWYGIKGFFEWLETKKYKIHVRVKLAKYRSYELCVACQGTRLKAESRNVLFRGRTIADLFSMNVGAARKFWELLPMSLGEEKMAGHLRREILNRLIYLDEVGLSYLTLDRQTRTLSGGESQRINLAAALGGGLTETMYVIDEPTVGLHARDSERLLAVLRRLSISGNTVIVVEHDPLIIAGADHLIELGPGAGELGGRLIFSGTHAEYESGRTDSPSEVDDEDSKPVGIDSPDHPGITIRGAAAHNLKNVDVTIPLNALVAIAGVSGSGKSSLIRDCLYLGFQRTYRGASSVDAGKLAGLEGVEQIDEIELVDQSPIGRSSRSNPATYVKAWDEIRKVLASTTNAKLNGITPGMLSFNTAGGRCEHCQGSGVVEIDMQFLADVEVSCEKCLGQRFTEKVLKLTYKGKNVAAILDMTVDEAIRFFVDRRAIVKKLDSLRSVGLGYLRLGQSTASLSGGEAQRLKLASFLTGSERAVARRLLLFDEPTTGLHSDDVRQLLRTFRDLIRRGHSLVVIEHNLQLIEAADYVIELGPEGGDGGGYVVATGAPAQLAANLASVTGRFLGRARFTPRPAQATALESQLTPD